MIRTKTMMASGLFAGALLLPTFAQADIQTAATHAIIYDYDTGDVLYCKDCDQQMPPSSMSKLMTVELIFQRLKDGRLKPTDTMHVSEDAWRQGQKDNESKMWVQLNSDISVDDLLKGIIVQSGGDACIVAADSISGSETAFADLENKRAKELGLMQSHFANSTGMPDAGQYMSARDLALLSAHIIRDYPQYYPYFAIKEFTWSNIKQGNRNELLYDNIGVDGLKTGHTEAGGYGMVTSAVRNGRRLIVVVNGLDKMKTRAEESRHLLDAGYRDFKHYDLVAANGQVGNAEVWGGTEDMVPLRVKDPVAVTLSQDARPDLKVTLRYNGPLKAPVAEGAQVGTLTVSAPNKLDTVVPVYAAQSVSSSGILGKFVLGVQTLLGRKAS
jgi:D-alanyl-D-alanine carboxypeptidase (penicillin-binding protein 5/6)